VKIFLDENLPRKLVAAVGTNYDVASDGRFLINTVLDDATPAPITLLQNWRPPAN